MSVSTRKDALTLAMSNYKTSSREVVLAFEGYLTDYSVSLSAHELNDIPVAMAEFPRMKAEAGKIIAKLGVKKVMNGDIITFENPKTFTKAMKVEVRAKIQEFIDAEHNSLMNVIKPKAKDDVVFDELEFVSKTRKAIMSKMSVAGSDGLSLDGLKSLVTALTNDLNRSIDSHNSAIEEEEEKKQALQAKLAAQSEETSGTETETDAAE